MTATPIPRTLHMSLSASATCRSSRRRRSDRLSIQTNVVKYDDGVIAGDPARDRTAAARSTSSTTASNIELDRRAPAALVPTRGIVVGHGQMAEDARRRHAALPWRRVRRAALHHHHRERPRHPQREHDHHQPGGPLRTVAALPVARPVGRSDRPRLRLPADRPPAEALLSCRTEAGWRRSRSSAISAAGFEWRRWISKSRRRQFLGGEQSGHLGAGDRDGIKIS